MDNSSDPVASWVKFCGSPLWDSNLTWSNHRLELTPCFERALLTWIPLIFLWFLAPFDAYLSVTSNFANIPFNAFNISKLIFNSTLIFFSLFDLLYNVVSGPIPILPNSYWAPILQGLTYGATFALTVFQVKKGRCSSGVLFIFWALSVFTSIPSFRSDILAIYYDYDTGPYLSDSIEFILKVAMLIMNLFADVRPLHSKLPIDEENPCPGNFTSAWSYFTASWFDSLAWKGYIKPLVLSDLWNIDPDLTSDHSVKSFEKYWNKAYEKNAKGGKKKEISIVGPCVKSFYKNFIGAHFMKISSDLIIFLNPYIIKSLLSFINSDEVSNWKGFLLAGLLIITSHLNYCLIAHLLLTSGKFGFNCKSAIIGAIYKKSLRLSVNARKESSFGEIANYIAIDATMIEKLGYFVIFAWTTPIQLVLIFILLYQLLGWSVIAGFVVLICIFPVNYIFAKKINELQMNQMASKDTRVKNISETLAGIKVLKFNAWEPFFETRISNYRSEETNGLKQIAYLKATLSCIWSCAICFMVLSTFAVFVLSDENNVLDVETAFTAISLFNILYWFTYILPLFVAFITQAVVSVKRVNKFLNSEEVDPTSLTHFNEKDQLVIEKGTFTWDKESNAVLKNISVNVSKGSLVAIVGSVGSGKSSLLSAFLGEMNKISGRVNAHGGIAYVPQVAWIQNNSVKGNILFGKMFSESRYEKVVEACALVEDLKMLPAGDETEIGEKGINLSGGQKQRVSLARAVYFDSDVYLLDDPLSAVDSMVGKHLFQNVIGPNGMLKDKTRLLVTHSLACLPETDYVIVLNEGLISEMGTYDELLNRNGSFKDLIQNYVSKSDNPEAENDELKDEEDLETTPFLINNNKCDETNSPRKRKTSSSLSPEKGDKTGNEKGELTEEEYTETGSVSWRVLYNYGKAIGPKFLILILFLSLVRQSFTIGGNYWISLWSTDKILLENGTDNKPRRDMYLGVYGVFIICQALSSYLSDLIPLIACLKASISLHKQLLAVILKAPMWFFDTTPLGRIISRFSKDVDSLDTMLPPVLAETITLFFEIGGIFFVVAFQSPFFILMLIPISFLYYLVRKFYSVTSTQVKRLESVTRSPIYSHFSETMSGMSVIKAFNQQDRFIRESRAKVDTNIRCGYSTLIGDCWMAMKLEMVGEAVILFAAISAVLTRHSVGAGTVALSLTYAITISRVFLMFMTQAMNVERNIVASERIQEYCEVPQEKSWDLAKDQDNKLWPEKGEIIFKDFKARYREGLSLVLKGITFTVKPGEKVGIVGRTGAGKSSLTLCLFRLVESAGGAILIDGIDIASLGLHRLRSSLNIISQDPILFSGTLRLNLDPLDKYSDLDVWKAIEMAHLKKYVSSLEAGLQYLITEDGLNLSVGQRQQVCLARALLNKSKILIMDEATAAIDLETDDLIQKTIREEFSHCTVLTIAHRINTILDSDRVLVLDGGCIAEFDSPEVLMSRPNSLFSLLAKNAGIDNNGKVKLC